MVAGANFIGFLFYILLLVAPIAAIADILPRSESDFVDSGQTRTTWLIAMIVGLVFCGLIGCGLGIYYFVAVKPKLPAKAPKP